jgi:hypothetical protein
VDEKPVRCARCGSPYWDRERSRTEAGKPGAFETGGPGDGEAQEVDPVGAALGLVEEPEVPVDVMLVSEVARRGGVDEGAVRTRALMMAGAARLHKLPDGRWVVAKEWAEARLQKGGA